MRNIMLPAFGGAAGWSYTSVANLVHSYIPTTGMTGGTQGTAAWNDQTGTAHINTVYNSGTISVSNGTLTVPADSGLARLTGTVAAGGDYTMYAMFRIPVLEKASTDDWFMVGPQSQCGTRTGASIIGQLLINSNWVVTPSGGNTDSWENEWVAFALTRDTANSRTRAKMIAQTSGTAGFNSSTLSAGASAGVSLGAFNSTNRYQQPTEWRYFLIANAAHDDATIDANLTGLVGQFPA